MITTQACSKSSKKKNKTIINSYFYGVEVGVKGLTYYDL